MLKGMAGDLLPEAQKLYKLVVDNKNRTFRGERVHVRLDKVEYSRLLNALTQLEIALTRDHYIEDSMGYWRAKMIEVREAEACLKEAV